MKSNSISIISNRRRISLSPEDILYVQLVNRQSVIHISGGKTYETYTTIDELAQQLGSGVIRADRATLVSAKAVHTIGKKIELINGEALSFTHRRKRELREQLRAGRREIVQSLSDSDAPATREEYRQHYASYDSAPFAFTDIEMVFNEERGRALRTALHSHRRARSQSRSGRMRKRSAARRLKRTMSTGIFSLLADANSAVRGLLFRTDRRKRASAERLWTSLAGWARRSSSAGSRRFPQSTRRTTGSA